MDKILIDAPSRLWLKNYTDFNLRIAFAAEMAGYGFYIPQSWLWNVVYNTGFIICRILARLSFGAANWGAKLFSGFRSALIDHLHPRVVITQGPYPPCVKNAMVIWETFFLGEDYSLVPDPEFKRSGSNFWVRQAEVYGPKVDVISVRGSRSVELLRKMYPEFAHKVVDLGFVKPEYRICDEGAIRQRQMLNDQIELLFVGHLAELKGLGELLTACKLLRDTGCRNFHLTIVSGLLNSPKVKIPNEDWVTWHRSLPHDKVMALMRRAQVFVLPSKADTYGLVYHEAMANGCVVCVRDAEPQREFVDYGKAGVLVDYRDVRGLAERLRAVVEDPARRVELATLGLRRYKEMYSQDTIRRNWLSVIRRREMGT